MSSVILSWALKIFWISTLRYSEYTEPCQYSTAPAYDNTGQCCHSTLREREYSKHVSQYLTYTGLFCHSVFFLFETIPKTSVFWQFCAITQHPLCMRILQTLQYYFMCCNTTRHRLCKKYKTKSFISSRYRVLTPPVLLLNHSEITWHFHVLFFNWYPVYEKHITTPQ